MKRELLIGALLTCLPARAGQRFAVAVCNLDHLPEHAVAQAEEEAGYVFSTTGVQVQWLECSAAADRQGSDRRFTVRLRRDGQFAQTEPAALARMGRAFVSGGTTGIMADAYFDSIREFALAHPVADAGQVLGYVIAHELGHLLLGPGHSPSGIMSSSWNTGQLRALQERALRFNKDERQAIACKLRQSGNAIAGRR